MRLIGIWHVFSRSFSDASWIAEADTLLEESIVTRRLGANVAADAVNRKEFRARAVEQLLRFFNDEDRDVR